MIETSESLVFYKDQWEIAHPSVLNNKGFPCPVCEGLGKIKRGNRTLVVPCEECDGLGKVSEAQEELRLAWFRRDGSFICFDYNNPLVQRLPQ